MHLAAQIQSRVSYTERQETLKQGNARPHMKALDGLRAIAILLVLCSHGAGNFGRLQSVAAGGWCGVDLFFVLSGFLITSGLLRTKGATNYFQSFYGKRFLRIFPVFYVALAGLFLVLPHIASSVPLPPTVDRKFYWLYLNNWTGLLAVPNLHIVGHFWSLAVEEQFYLLWPAIVFFCSRKQVTAIAISCIVIAPILRAVFFHLGFAPETIYRNTFCRMDGLMAGALCAVILLSNQGVRKVMQNQRYLLAFSVLVLLAVPISLGHQYQTCSMLVAGLTFYVLGFSALLLCCALPENLLQPLTWRPLRQIGVWSYGIYVYHLGIYYAMSRWLPLSPGMQLIVGMLLSVGVAAFSYQLFEMRILRWKSLFSPRYGEAKMISTMS